MARGRPPQRKPFSLWMRARTLRSAARLGHRASSGRIGRHRIQPPRPPTRRTHAVTALATGAAFGSTARRRSCPDPRRAHVPRPGSPSPARPPRSRRADGHGRLPPQHSRPRLRPCLRSAGANKRAPGPGRRRSRLLPLRRGRPAGLPQCIGARPRCRTVAALGWSTAVRPARSVRGILSDMWRMVTVESEARRLWMRRSALSCAVRGLRPRACTYCQPPSRF